MRRLEITAATMVCGFLAFFGSALVARGDGLIVVNTPVGANPAVIVPPGHFTFAPLEVTYHRVNVSVEDQIAVTSVDQEFYNPNAQRLEGTYLFPLPEGAHIDKFSMDINGKQMDAELLSADKARSLYEDIVRKMRDPALLEYAGRDAFKVRIFPIEPNSRKQIKITYTQLLKSDSGLTEYVYPLNTEKFSARPLKDVAVRVTLSCKESLKSVYCPSHDVDIKRDGDRRAVIGFEAHDIRPDTDFKVIYSRAKNPVGIDLLTYRNAPDDGYFLLLASPGMESSDGKVQARDVCFVIDTSGSMAGPKMEQARKALQFCLANLNEGDRFEIIRFSTEAQNLFGELKPATGENIGKAQSFVRALKPIGGTAIDDALQKALRLDRGTGFQPVPSDAPEHGLKTRATGERPYVIIFLTDGQPTVGETREDPIVEHTTNKATGSSGGSGTRIFCFGIGTDINTHLLDRIANQTKAFSTYVLSEEDIEVKVSNFYTKIKEPVLSNVEMAFTGSDIHVSQVYPNSMPDLFKGETLMAFGRYSGTGAAAVKISGTINGEKRDFTTDVNFVVNDTKSGFIPRLWATRRVGWLLDEIRLRGESPELKDEVVKLAREHGIVTPYTAYLILEDEKKRDVPIAMRSFREMEGDVRAINGVSESYASAARNSGRLEKAGERAVANSAAVQKLKDGANEQVAQAAAMPKSILGGGVGAGSGAPFGLPTTQPAGYRQSQNYAQQARVINGRAFYQNGNTWTDSLAQSKKDMKRQEVKFNSDEYFALLQKHPHAAAWLALGNEVDVVLDDTLYVVR